MAKLSDMISSLDYATPGSPPVKAYDPSDSDDQEMGPAAKKALSDSKCATCDKPIASPDSSPSLGGIKSNTREMAPAE